MSKDLTTMDSAKPDGATETVSVLDNYERETRLNLKDWGGVEHQLNGGRHKIPFGNTANRPTTDLGPGVFYINTERGTLEYYDGGWKDAVVVTKDNVIRARLNATHGSPPTINNSFNVASLVYVSAGKYRITWTTAFANAFYVCTGNIASGAQGFLTFSEYAISSVIVNVYNQAGARMDEPFTVTATGDQ